MHRVESTVQPGASLNAQKPAAGVTLFSCIDLAVSYSGIRAVRKISFDIRGGETLVLVGANGAGKSSVINAIMGLVPSTGQLTFADQDITGSSVGRRARGGLRLSPEGRRVFNAMTVEENIITGTFHTKRSRQEALAPLYEAFPMLEQKRRQLAGTLSGGQQQLLAIARALAGEPRLLLLDEPFLGLSPRAIKETSRAITMARERGMSVLLAEQMARPALRLADRGCVLRGGEIRAVGSVEEIRSRALHDDYL